MSDRESVRKDRRDSSGGKTGANNREVIKSIINSNSDRSDREGNLSSPSVTNTRKQQNSRSGSEKNFNTGGGSNTLAAPFTNNSFPTLSGNLSDSSNRSSRSQKSGIMSGTSPSRAGPRASTSIPNQSYFGTSSQGRRTPPDGTKSSDSQKSGLGRPKVDRLQFVECNPEFGSDTDRSSNKINLEKLRLQQILKLQFFYCSIFFNRILTIKFVIRPLRGVFEARNGSKEKT